LVNSFESSTAGFTAKITKGTISPHFY